MRLRVCTAVGVCLALIACGDSHRPVARISLPDLSRTDPAVQDQIREQFEALQQVVDDARASDAERADAYGKLGMLLHAAEFHDAAEPAYLEAQQRAPHDPRWPYYLAHLHKSGGRVEAAVAAFTRVLELRPNDAPALIWLARMRLDQGRTDDAARLFERAQAVAPGQVAVLAGLGQVALARRDFERAIDLLERALAVDKSAASLHSPLAAAYRASGNLERAAAHQQQWRNTEILVPDPLRRELDLALDSGLSFELRGVRALEARDFAAAATFFQRGAAQTSAATPLGRSLRHKLGTALFLAGNADGAIERFEEVLAFAPDSGLDETAAKAHYSLGVIAATRGRDTDAIAHMSAAVRYSPHYVEARQALGDALRRKDRDADALEHYAAILRIAPRSADARFGYAMALVRLQRYREAHDWLAETMRLHPEREDVTHAMARLLAAAPDDGVRDGRRALALVDSLLTGPKTVALGETTAMALAEMGRFDEAVAVQQQIIRSARDSGLAVDRQRMDENLRRYVARQPCRSPWTADDPIFRPPPPTAPSQM